MERLDKTGIKLLSRTDIKVGHEETTGPVVGEDRLRAFKGFGKRRNATKLNPQLIPHTMTSPNIQCRAATGLDWRLD